jgi:hypothetical protein
MLYLAITYKRYNNTAIKHLRETVNDDWNLSHSNISKEFTISIKPKVEGLYMLSLSASGTCLLK